MWSRSRLNPKDVEQKYQNRPNQNSSKPALTSKQPKTHQETTIVAEALRHFGNELRNFILVNDKLKKRKPSYESLLRRLGHMNQLTNFEVDSDVLATIQSVKKKHRKHPSDLASSKKKRKRIICMLNSRALDKIIGESNQLQNEETKCSDVSTDVQISKMPKEHYQIVIKKKKKNDERQEEKKNEDQDVNIEQENEGERRDEERKECGSKDSIKVMSNKNPKEKLREEKVYTMFQPFCRIKDENKKREDKNNGEAVGGSKTIKHHHKSKEINKKNKERNTRTKAVLLERRSSKSCNGHVETCEYRLKPQESKKPADRKKKVSWDNLVKNTISNKPPKNKAKESSTKRKEARKSDKGSQVVTSKAVGTMKAADDVEGPSTNMFKKASLSLVQECSETVTANNNRESSSDLNCRRINNRNVYPGCSFDAKQKVDVLQLYRIKDSTSSTTSNATQYQINLPEPTSQAPQNNMDQLLLDKFPQRDIDGKHSDLPLARMMLPQNFLPGKLPFPRSSNFFKPGMFSQRHSQEARGSFTEPPKTERMRKLDSVVHPVFDNKFNSSLPKVPRIKNNLTVNTFHVTVEPVTAKMGTLEKPDQSLNLVTLPIWELKLADGPNLENLQNADLPIVEKASSWILKLPKDSLKKIKINETKPNISKKEFLEQKHKLKYSTFLQDDLIKTETSRSKLQRCTVKQDERKDNRLNLKVEKERSDKSVQFPSASGDRSSSLAEDSDECIMKLYICKKGRTKKSKNVTKNEESEEYLNKMIQKIRRSLTENSESSDSSVEVCCEEVKKKRNLRRSSQMKMVVRKPSVKISLSALKQIRSKKHVFKPPENLQCISYSTVEKGEDTGAVKIENESTSDYSVVSSIPKTTQNQTVDRGKVFNEDFGSSCNFFVETSNLTSDLGSSNNATRLLRSKIPIPQKCAEKKFSSLMKKLKTLNKPPSISSSETSNELMHNVRKPTNKKDQPKKNIACDKDPKSLRTLEKVIECENIPKSSRIPKKLPTSKISRPVTNNGNTIPSEQIKASFKKSSNSLLCKFRVKKPLKPVTNNGNSIPSKKIKASFKNSSNSLLSKSSVKKKLSITSSSAENSRKLLAQEHQSFQKAEKKQTNGSSNRPKFKRNISMLPIPRKRTKAPIKIEEETKSNCKENIKALKNGNEAANPPKKTGLVEEDGDGNLCKHKEPDSTEDQPVSKRQEQNKEKSDLHALLKMEKFNNSLEVAKKISHQQSCLDNDVSVTKIATPCNKLREDPLEHSSKKRVVKSRIPISKKTKNLPKVVIVNRSLKSKENDGENKSLENVEDNTCPDCLYCKVPAEKVQPSEDSINEAEISNPTFNFFSKYRNITETSDANNDSNQQSLYTIFDAKSKHNSSSSSGTNSTEIYNKLTTFNLLWHDQNTTPTPNEPNEDVQLLQKAIGEMKKKPKKIGQRKICLLHSCQILKRSSSSSQSDSSSNSSEKDMIVAREDRIIAVSQEHGDFFGYYHHLCSTLTTKNKLPQLRHSLSLSGVVSLVFPFSVYWSKRKMEMCQSLEQEESGYESYRTPRQDGFSLPLVLDATTDPPCANLELASYRVSVPDCCKPNSKWYYMGKKDGQHSQTCDLNRTICRKCTHKDTSVQTNEQIKKEETKQKKPAFIKSTVEKTNAKSTEPKDGVMKDVTVQTDEKRKLDKLKEEEMRKGHYKKSIKTKYDDKVLADEERKVVGQRNEKKPRTLVHEKVTEKKKPEEVGGKVAFHAPISATGKNEMAVEAKLPKQTTTDTGTETKIVSSQEKKSDPPTVSKARTESEIGWIELKALAAQPITLSEENVYFKDIHKATSSSEPEESVSASKLYLPKMGETEIDTFNKHDYDTSSVISISSMDEPKPGTSNSSTSSTRLRRMLESPIASIISMAKRKVRKISAQKFPPLEFIKENEEKEIQTADYSSKIEKEDTNKEKTVRLSDEVERIKEPTVDPIKMAENPKPVKNPKPIRKVESKEATLDFVPAVKKPSSKTIHLNIKELDTVQSLDKIEAYIKNKIDETITILPAKQNNPKSVVKTAPTSDDNENETKMGFRSCKCSMRQTMTDKELFERLLRVFEKQEGIVEKLSQDEHFIKSQLNQVKSTRSLEEIMKNFCKNHKCQHAMTSEEILRGLGTQTEHAKHEHEEAGADESPTKFSKFTNFFKRRKSSIKEIYGATEDTKRFYSDDTGLVGSEDEEQRMKIKFSEDQSGLLDRDLRKAAANMSDVSNMDRILAKETGVADFDPTMIGKCFQRGFRSDHISLSGETCLLLDIEDEKRRSRGESANIDFSERETPMDFLLALGFSIDEASNALKDDDVRNRLQAAIVEARVWINQISPMQGTLVYLVAYKAKPKIMRYFLQLVEAVINDRISDAVKLDTFIRMLEKVEDGDLTAINILGADRFEDEQNEERLVKKQLRQLFLDVYQVAESEAEKVEVPLSKEAVSLLRMLAAKYRAGLHPHLELIAQYIGQGLLNTEVQLEAAMIYLSRLETAEVNLAEFEQYCAIKCPIKGRVEKDEAEDSLWL